MAYIIFQKDTEDTLGTYYRIAANDADKTALDIDESNYKIIDVSDTDFGNVRNGTKEIRSYNGNTITYADSTYGWPAKSDLQEYADDVKQICQNFVDNHSSSHAFYDRVNNYLTVLSASDLLDDITTWPYTSSLESFLAGKSVAYLNPLQIP